MSKFSVVIPLYNKAAYIGNTLKSVLNQTFSDYEVVIVDDGSTDESVEVINNTFSSDKIRIIQKKNGGPSSARNLGVKEAKGDWIVFLDADDYLLPYALTCFSSLIEKYKEDNVNYYVCNYYIKYGDDIRLFSKVKKNGIVRNPFYLETVRDLTERAGSSVINRSLLLEHPFNEKLRRYEDAECQYEIMRSNRLCVCPVPVMISDRDATSAAGFRKDINEDFIGCLNFDNKSYWEQMALYLLALECKNGYPNNANMYSKIYNRLDLKLGFIFIRIRNKIVKTWRNVMNPTPKLYLDELLSKKNYDGFCE